MIVTKSNYSTGSTVTVTGGNPLLDPVVLVDGDFSSRYAAPVNNNLVFVFNMQSLRNVSYFAVGGSNIYQQATATVAVSTDNVSYTDVAMLAGNANNEAATVVFDFNTVNTRYVRLTITGYGNVSISDIAFGEYYTIPNDGEQAGYNRPWSVTNVKSRQATSIDGAPIALVYEAREIKPRLDIPNNVIANYGEFQQWERFASVNTFYVKEDNVLTHSYAAFNASFAPMTAHNSTRALGGSTVTFSAHAKISEAWY